jgi:hypothetical protein
MRVSVVCPSFNSVFRAGLTLLWSFAGFAFGQDSTRVVVIQMPTPEVSLTRAELGSPGKSASASSIDSIITRRGMKLLADFRKTGDNLCLMQIFDKYETGF